MPTVSTRDLEKFSRKFGKMLGSGIPLVTTLELISREESDTSLGPIINQIIAKLQDGYTFSSCLAMFPGIFTEVYVAMSRAAENQGRLDTGMIDIADACADGTVAAGQGDSLIDESAAMPHENSLKVVNYLNQLISDAVKQNHAQIIFKPERDHVKLIARVNGKLLHKESLDKDFYDFVIARVKLMSALDIAERHLPQDGRILIKVDTELADIRVQLVPSIFGEQVMLFFDRLNQPQPSLEKIFPDPKQRERLEKLLKNISSGVVIFAGPSGSGKTTTLETATAMLNDGSRLIFSVSSMCRSLEGITSIQLRPHAGMDMLNSVRTAIRAEPDVLVVEDLCDEATALECFKAANQGMLVLTQMSARNSAEVFRQLINLKVPSYLLYGGIGAISFQVLVRKICPDCSKESNFTAEDLFRLSLTDMTPGKYHESSGCSACNNSGYRGRIPFYEISVPDKNLKEALIKAEISEIITSLDHMHGASLNKIREFVESGATTPQEASRIKAILCYEN